ncbi:MAG: TonB-dependent receptor plug domain-containing protein [Bacteroidota bacterium]
MKNKIMLFLIVGFWLSCGSSSQTTTNTSTDQATVSQQTNLVSLTDMLRKEAGVMVQGNGKGAKIRIRNGGQSILGSSEPLYVLNGQPLAGGIAEVIDLVNVLEIKDLIVLKSANETAAYGVRGANGVIEIMTE